MPPVGLDVLALCNSEYTVPQIIFSISGLKA